MTDTTHTRLRARIENLPTDETGDWLYKDDVLALLATPPGPQETAGEAERCSVCEAPFKETAGPYGRCVNNHSTTIRTLTAAPTDNAALVEAKYRDLFDWLKDSENVVLLSVYMADAEKDALRAALASHPIEETSREQEL